MAAYRHRPTEVEAFQWFDTTAVGNTPEWFVKAFENNCVIRNFDGTITVMTTEGSFISREGDFIVKASDNEMYACKPEVFAGLYDRV